MKIYGICNLNVRNIKTLKSGIIPKCNNYFGNGEKKLFLSHCFPLFAKQTQSFVMNLLKGTCVYFCALTKSQWTHPDISTLRLLYRRILQSHTCTSADSPSRRFLLDRSPHSSVLWTPEDTDMPPSQDRKELRSRTYTSDCNPAPSVGHHRLKGNKTNCYLLIMKTTYPNYALQPRYLNTTSNSSGLFMQNCL